MDKITAVENIRAKIITYFYIPNELQSKMYNF